MIDSSQRWSLSNESIQRAVEHAWSEARELCHALHLLIAELKYGFCERRAIAKNEHTVTLMFSREGIDATMWLVDHLYKQASALAKDLTELSDKMEDELESKREVA